MSRLHLFELHEQPWCPAAIRDGATDCLRFIATVGNQYKHVVPLLQQALLTTDAPRIIDLCSGGGGPWHSLASKLRTGQGDPVQILLTDLYPNQGAGEARHTATPQLHFIVTPVDATQLPADLTGFRTLFTAFHHFSPQHAQAILQDAVNANQGIAIFEQTARTPVALLTMFLLPFLGLLAAPFIWPWRRAHFFWTFIIPAIPLVLWFDGMISCLRTYSASELAMLIDKLDPAPSGVVYIWQIGKVRSPLSPIGVSYVIGYPANGPTTEPVTG